MNQTPARSAISWSTRIDAALRFAAAAHHEDVRKGTQIPYVMHPFHVGLILDRHGFSEDVVVAGILHDVLEDPDYEAGLYRRDSARSSLNSHRPHRMAKDSGTRLLRA